MTRNRLAKIQSREPSAFQLSLGQCHPHGDYLVLKGAGVYCLGSCHGR
jgi:hypothetical protein